MPRQPNDVTLVEVGPRDGLQNEPIFVATHDKIHLINLLSQSGLTRIEATSFVSAKAIPQLQDGQAVYQAINKPQCVNFSVLIPNECGMQQAIHLGVREIAVFTSVSEQFNQRNIHCSIAESLVRFQPVMNLAKQHRIKVRAYVSCVLGCPYEGLISPKKVLELTEQLLALGVDEISLGDTLGVGTPKQTKAVLRAIQSCMPIEHLAMHFHDTYGQAMANIYAALNAGVRIFDSSVAGLGGCPYAQGASGNVATEDVLYLMHGLGIKTGIDIYSIVTAGDWICTLLGRKNQSKVASALLLKGGT